MERQLEMESTGVVDRVRGMYEDVMRDAQLRRAAAAVLLSFQAGIAGVGIKHVQEFDESLIRNPIECSDDSEDCDRIAASLGASRVLLLQEDEQTMPAPETTAAVALPPSTIAPAPPPPGRIEHRTPIDAETAANIEAMNLTADGYRDFFNRIDLSLFDYAQSKATFNPAMARVPQNPTEWVTAHYTAAFANPNGSADFPEGPDMAVDRLIDFMAGRGNPCCAANFFIDRNGKVFQVAPFNAKLRHDGVNDGRTTGWELEAAYQHQIRTEQYEAAAYLTIAMLQNEGLLSADLLPFAFRGHGENRDIYREQHPHDNKWGVRDDFDEPIMHLLRTKMADFLQRTPNVREITQPLR